MSKARKKPLESDFELWLRPENEPGAFGSQHLIRGHTFNAERNARIGDLDLLRRGRRDLVRYHYVPVSKRVGDQVVIRDLKKRADRCWLVALTRCPGADRA